jgi:formylmethanofuran dehydrogenase subunit C
MTSYVSTISHKRVAFDKEFSKLEAEKPLEIKAEIDSILHEIWRRISPTEKFIKILKDPAVWDKFDSNVKVEHSKNSGEKDWMNYPINLEEIEEIFGNFDYKGSLSNEHYADFVSFLNTFKEWVMTHIESLRPEGVEYFWDNQESISHSIIRGLNSIFLEKTMKAESSLVLNDLPKELTAYTFGAKLKTGRIEIDEVDNGLGQEMSGGEIVAKKAGTHAGSGMTGGRLAIGEVCGTTGSSMQGGKIVVERSVSKDESGCPFAYESDHGTIIANIVEDEVAGCGSWTDILINEAKRGKLGAGKGGGTLIANRSHGELGRPDGYSRKECFATLLVGEYDDGYPQGSNFETYSYNDNNKIYIDLRKREVVSSYIANDEELTEFKKKRCGLVVVNKYSDIQQNITDGMDGGIVVLKQLPTSELGKGMNRGAVVVDIPGITKERIRKVLSKDRSYGLILMRVPDPDDPKKTKLIDVED